MSVLSNKLPLLRARVEYQGGVLALACALVTLALLIGRQFTQEPIAARLQEDRLALLGQVLPAALYDNNPLQTRLVITDSALAAEPVEVLLASRAGTLTAGVFQLGAPGYGGMINLIMAVDAQGAVLGVRVISHTETPGLADKIEIRKGKWIQSFDGHSLASRRWAVKKDGGDFDQFAGATITPRAVVAGVKRGLEFAQHHQAEFAAAAAAGGNP